MQCRMKKTNMSSLCVLYLLMFCCVSDRKRARPSRTSSNGANEKSGSTSTPDLLHINGSAESTNGGADSVYQSFSGLEDNGIRPSKARKTRRGTNSSDNGVNGDENGVNGANGTKAGQIESPASLERISPINQLLSSSSMSRGYYAVFHWDHYPFTVREGIKSWVRPTQTNTVGSIPSLFFYVIGVLSEVEAETRHRDLLPLIDKRLTKLIKSIDNGVTAVNHHLMNADQGNGEHVHVQDNEFHESMKSSNIVNGDVKQLTLRDLQGNEYAVTACRKEHFKLLYDAPDGGILHRLGFCPMLLDIMHVNNGQITLVGGANESLRQSEQTVQIQFQSPKDVRCTCQDQSTLTAIEDHNKMLENPPTEIQRIAPVTLQLKNTALSVASADLTDAFAKPDSINSLQDDKFVLEESATPLSASTGRTSTNFPTAPDIASTTPSTPSEHSDDMNGRTTPPSVIDSTIVNGIEEVERERFRKKISNLQRTIAVLNEELRTSRERAHEWENKWKEEKDTNVKLWDRVLNIQKQLRHMSRPVTTLLNLQTRMGS